MSKKTLKEGLSPARFVGGVDNYLKILKSVSDSGTYLFTPTYSKSWREPIELDRLHHDPAKVLKIMKKTREMIGYKKVAKIGRAHV